MHNVAMPGADVSCLCVVEQAAALDAEPQARYKFMTIKVVYTTSECMSFANHHNVFLFIDWFA
jgi:hypothetical protein